MSVREDEVRARIDAYLEAEPSLVDYLPVDGNVQKPKEETKAEESSDQPEEPEEQEKDEEVENTPDEGKEDDAKQEGDDASEEVELPKSVSELADAIGLKSEELMAMQAEVIVDGEKRSVPLSEVIDNYQRQGSYTKKSQALASERNGFYQRKENAEARIRNDLLLAEQQVKTLEEEITSALNSPYLQKMFDEDPQAWAQETIRLKDKSHSVAQLRAKVDNDILAYEQRRSEEHKERIQEITRREQMALLDKLPEWSDKSKAAQEWSAIADYAEKTFGFSKEELANTLDHRLILLAREAYSSQRQKQAVNQLAKKKLTALPRVRVKPGVKEETSQTKVADERKTALRKQARKAPTMRGREAAATQLITDLLGA